MAARAEAARRRRRLQAGIGAGVAVALVIAGTVWLVTRLGADKNATATATPSAAACQWHPEPDPSASPAPSPDPKHFKDVGTPPTNPPTSGTRTMKVTTNQGDIEIKIDNAKTPCAAASFAYLASKQFFDNTKCHRLTTEGIFVLQCGDPASDGLGGPSYRYVNENLPEGHQPTYPEGTVALALPGDPATQQPKADSSGSQFFVVYKDSGSLPAQYPVLGTITKGLDIVKKVAEAGAVGTDGKAGPDGKPKTEVVINSVTVS
jgi:peptidyl-prolyl cis-trans isomerase B (cyclophilin B)